LDERLSILIHEVNVMTLETKLKLEK
jgi:hypothetical protein